MTIRIGAKVPNSGPLPERAGSGRWRAELEAAGFESLWVSDHIVLPADDRVALPVCRRRARHVADGHAVLRRPDRARADRRRRPSGPRSAPRCSCCRCGSRSSSRSRPRRSTSRAAAGCDSASAPAGSRRSSTRSTCRSSTGAAASRSGSSLVRNCWTGAPEPSHSSCTVYRRACSACRRRRTTSHCSSAATRAPPSDVPGASATAGSPSRRSPRSTRTSSSVAIEIMRAAAAEARRDPPLCGCCSGSSSPPAAATSSLVRLPELARGRCRRDHRRRLARARRGGQTSTRGWPRPRPRYELRAATSRAGSSS